MTELMLNINAQYHLKERSLWSNNQSINQLYLPSNLHCNTEVLISSSQKTGMVKGKYGMVKGKYGLILIGKFHDGVI